MKEFSVKFSSLSLQEASEKGELEVVKRLCTHDGMTKAMCALEESEVFQFIKKPGGRIIHYDSPDYAKIKDFLQNENVRRFIREEISPLFLGEKKDGGIIIRKERIEDNRAKIEYINPLHYTLANAIEGYCHNQNRQYLEVVQYLLSVGADPNILHIIDLLVDNPTPFYVTYPILKHDWENENVHPTLTEPFSEITKLLIKAGFLPHSDFIQKICTLQNEKRLTALKQIVKAGVPVDYIINCGYFEALDAFGSGLLCSSSPLTLFLKEYYRMIEDYLSTQFKLSHFNGKECQDFTHWFLRHRVFIFNFLETYQSVIETFPFEKYQVKKGTHASIERTTTWYILTSKERFMMKHIKATDATNIRRLMKKELAPKVVYIDSIPELRERRLPLEVTEKILHFDSRQRLSKSFDDYIKRILNTYLLLDSTKNNQDYMEIILDRFFIDETMKIRDHQNTWFNALKDPFKEDFDEKIRAISTIQRA